jgi:hypothetical protein
MNSGSEAGELCTMAGIPPDAWQQSVLDRVFATGSDGKAAEPEIRAFAREHWYAARMAYQCALSWLFLADERICWSGMEPPGWPLGAMEDLINGNDFLQRRVTRISRLNGGERIDLRSGGRIAFTSRATSGCRGFSASKLIIASASRVSSAQLRSLLPFVMGAPDPQVLYFEEVLDLGGGYCAVPQ